jgi:putative ABC transport system permease protein
LVTERTREIGIRKAIGATNRQILSQFLAEVVVLSVIGSLCGIIGAVIVNVALRIFTDLQPVWPWAMMAISSGVAIAVGIIFGMAPAIKAARKEPIEALRNE